MHVFYRPNSDDKITPCSVSFMQCSSKVWKVQSLVKALDLWVRGVLPVRIVPLTRMLALNCKENPSIGLVDPILASENHAHCQYLPCRHRAK